MRTTATRSKAGGSTRSAAWGVSHGRRSAGFTLVELLLVMTVVVATIAISAPTLANFFRGRTLDSEARRLLALTHSGQSRAVSEGVPMRLWVNAEEKSYGLEQEPGWDERDPKAIEFELDKDLKLEVVQSKPPGSSSRTTVAPPGTGILAMQSKLNSLPELRFMPDGSIAESSPRAVKISDRDGISLWLAQARNGLRYEIRSTFDPSAAP